MWEIPTAYLVFSAIMSAVGVGVSAYNAYQNKKTMQQNANLQQSQYDYQKELNETVMAREDNAMQRQVEDLKAAGLSPLMISGGANATPLTSANAPQMDMSGMNESIQNAIGAYNDIFNRHLQEKQFRLQAKLQTEKTMEDIEASRLNRDYIQAQKDYLNEKLNWEKTNGFRDINLSSVILNNLEEYIKSKNGGSVIPSQENKDKAKNYVTDIINSLTGQSDTSTPEQNTDVKPDPLQAPDWFTRTAMEGEVKAKQENMRKKDAKDYKLAQNIISTRSPNLYGKDKQTTQAIDFIYRHTNAHKDYATVYLFRNALIKNKKIARSYELNVYE